MQSGCPIRVSLMKSPLQLKRYQSCHGPAMYPWALKLDRDPSPSSLILFHPAGRYRLAVLDNRFSGHRVAHSPSIWSPFRISGSGETSRKERKDRARTTCSWIMVPLAWAEAGCG